MIAALELRRPKSWTSWIVPVLLIGCAVFLLVGSLRSSLFAQQTVAGLANGGIYASLGVALVLIYRATQVINFAQGALATFTTYIAWQLITWGLSYWPAFFLTLVIAFAGGILVELVAIRPVERRGNVLTVVINFAQGAIATFTTYVAWQLMTWGLSYWPAFFLTLAIAFVGGTLLELITIRPVERRGNVLTVVIATLGVLILVEGSVGWIWGAEIRFMPPAFPAKAIHVHGVAFSIQDLGTIAISLASVVVLWLLFQFTKLGLAMRAAALRPQAARLVGVRVSWMLSLGWGLAAALGAVAGMMAAASPSVLLQPNMMDGVLIYAFAAAVLGGLESPLGAVIGGLLIGAMLNLLGSYVGWVTPQLLLPAAFVVMLVVLLVKPSGLFGRTQVRRV